MRHTNRLATVLLLALVVLAGCSAGGSGGAAGGDAVAADREQAAAGEPGAATSTPVAEQTPAAADREGGGDGGEAREFQGQVRTRAIIRTGQVQLEVEDFDTAKRTLRRLAERRGGFVSDSHERRHRVDNETYKTGSVTLRVPREEFDAVMERINETGTVMEASVESRDVTEQLVDINARLRNLRAERDRLRELYQEAEDTEAILKVERRLSEVQTRIERLEARKQSLKRQVALSTIRVELREPRPDPEFDPDRWYEAGVISAFLESVSGVAVVARALVVGLAYALPYLAVFGLPVVAVGYAVWRRRR